MRLKDINSSKFKKSIEIQSFTSGSNKEDIPIDILKESISKKTWAIPATSVALRRQEFHQAQGINIKKCIEFVIRFMQIDISYKVVFKDEVYEIKGIENVELADKYLVLVTERVS